MRTLKKYKLVYIEWTDAESDAKWSEPSEVKDWIKEDCTVKEIGWIVQQNKKHLIISNQILYDGTVGNKTKIPLVWIRKRRNINERQR